MYSPSNGQETADQPKRCSRYPIFLDMVSFVVESTILEVHVAAIRLEAENTALTKTVVEAVRELEAHDQEQ